MEEKKEYAALYALDLLDAHEAKEFEKWLREDKSLREEVRKMERTHEIALHKNATRNPSPRVFKKIRNKIQKPDSKIIRAVWFGRVGWGMAACMLLGMVLFSGQTRSNEDYEALAAKMEQLESMLNQGKTATTAIGNDNATHYVLAQLNSPDRLAESKMDSVKENGEFRLSAMSEGIWQLTEFQKQMSMVTGNSAISAPPIGYVMVDVESHIGYLAVDNMPHPSENSHYQVWLVPENGNKPIYGGILPELYQNSGLLYFDLNKTGNAHNSSGIKSIIITEETKLQKDSPQGKIVLRT